MSVATMRQKTIPVEVITVMSPAKIIVRYTLDALEEQLSGLEQKIMRSYRRRQERNLDNETLEIDAHVLVVSVEFEGARRGLIVDINREVEPESYGIFLYDYGLFRAYERNFIEPLKSNFRNDLAPCACYVILPGLVPSTFIPGFPNGLSVPAQEWSDEALEYAKSWTRKCLVHLLKFSPVDDVTICGDFYHEGERKPLSASLIDEKFAMHDETEYLKLMGSTEEAVNVNTPEVDSRKSKRNEKKEDIKNEIPIPVSGIKAKFAKLRVTDLEDTDGDEAASLEGQSQTGDNKNETTIASLPVKVLRRGKNILAPYNQLENFPLQELIVKTLQCEMQISQINFLQRSSWPYVLRGRNCFIIGGQSKRKGKSLSYIVPIAAICLSELELSNKTSENATTGPIGLFICSSMHSGEKLKEHMDHLLGRSKIAVYLAIAATGDLKYKLRENPEFIITTPDFVHILLENHYVSFGFERLRFLVFDDAHLLLKYKLEPVTSLIQKLSHYLEKIEKRSCSLQTIFCGQEWNQEMEAAFLNVAAEPVLIIGSSFQAIAYGRINVRVHFVRTDEKADKLADLIEDKIQRRTVILCQTQETVVHIGHNLYRNKGIRTVYLPVGDVTSDQITEMRNEWLNSRTHDRLLFICTDSDLRDLNLQDVETIIHFEMPSTKLETFGDRHVCMWNLFYDISKTVDENVPLLETELMSHVFLTPDEPDLHKIVRHFRKINVDIPQSLNVLTEIASKEELKRARLCESIRRFGKCDKDDKQDCDDRHFFNEEELFGESTVPRVGRVEIEITHCEYVNSFKAKLHHYYKVVNGRKVEHVSFLNMLKKREDDLTKYYSEESNRVPLPNPKKKALCGFQSNEGTNYTRGRIEVILQSSELGYPVQVRVFCMDTGLYAVRCVNDLYILPEEFVSLHPTCVDVILADLKPTNGEEQFKLLDNVKARKLTDGQIYTARIALSIGNTLWVKPMAEYERDRSGDLVQRRNVRMEFTKNMRVAEDNPNHLARLYEMCESNGFNCDIYRTSESIGRDFEETYYLGGEPIFWAYLRTHSIDDNPKTDQVWSTFVTSPDLVYVTLDKFVDLLDDVNKELEEHVLTQIEGHYADYASRFHDYYEKGMCVAAKERLEKVWNRAIITKIREDVEDGKKLFDVFFVDHGDTGVDMSAFELFPIPKKFVNQLPFQVIALRINHVCREEVPENTSGEVPEWDKMIQKALYDLLFIDDKSKCLDVMPVERLRKFSGNVPPCEYYEAFVFVEDKELGEFLVENNYAKYCPGMEVYLKQVKKNLLDKLNSLVDSQLKLGTNDDDEDDEVIEAAGETTPGLPNFDDFDIYLGEEGAEGFVNNIFPNMVGKRKNGTVALPGGSDEPTPSTSTSLRAELASNSTAGNSVSTSSSLPDNSANEIVRAPTNLNKTDNTSRKNPETTKKLPKQDRSGDSESTDYTRKPMVHWTQTDSAVTLRIGIPDLKKYSLNIADDKRSVSFHSEDTPPKNYSFELQLFGKVIPTPEYTPLGQHLIVKFTKLTQNTKWPSITREKVNSWWLKRDLSNLDADDSDDMEDDDVDIGDGFGVPTPQRGEQMKENQPLDTLKEKRSYENMPVDFEGDEDSFSSDSDISDDAERDADIYRTKD